MLIKRQIFTQVESAIKQDSKAVIIYGPRQAGKTTLIKDLFPEQKDALFFIGDDLYAQEVLGKPELEKIKRVVGDNKIIVIDEAQRIDDIGLTIKLMIDNLQTMVVASGSASFDLANKLSEPLTGRTKTFLLYPFSYQEIKTKYAQTLPATALSEILRFGSYPKVHQLTSDAEKQDYLFDYLNNYLYKDILMFGDIRKPKKVMDLLTLLALQIGKEVAVSELAQNLAVSQKTVENYLDILEKMFIVVNLRGFSRNLRKEISKTSKYFFVDNGLRNAVIRNFNNLELRSDAGELFENWFVMEKIKLSNFSRSFSNFYFWRTYDQQEIDLIEENQGKLIGYECKLSPKKEPTSPKDWQITYPTAEFKTVNSDNCFDFLV